MYLNELLRAVQYVTDNQGNRQAVLLDLEIWQTLLDHLELPDQNEVVDERQAAMDREEMAYQEMHEELYAKYPGKHVAVYQGRLVDRDRDAGALYQRVRQKYPGEFVLVTPVGPEKEEIYRILSPRLETE